MKKALAFLLVVSMLFSLVACDFIEGTPQSGGDLLESTDSSVSTDDEEKLSDTAAEGSLTIVETSSGYYATVTHPVISREYLESDGAIIVNFHFDNQEGWPYYFTVNQNFSAQFYAETNDEHIMVEHSVVGGNFTFISENLPINLEDMDYASVIITQNSSKSDYYAEFEMEDILSFNDNYALPVSANKLSFVQCFTEGDDTAYLQTLIDEFNTIDPDIQVNLITLPEDEMVDYLLDENNSADIFTVNSYHTADLYGADKLASLDEFMAQAISLDVTGIEQDITDLEYYITEFRGDTFTEIDGSTYSVPLFADSSALFYSFKEIGPTGSMEMITNYEGLVDIAQWGTNPDLGYYGMSLLLTNKEPVKSATDTILPILYGNNGSLMAGDTFTVDTPEMLQTMQLLETLGTNGYVMPGTSQKTEEEVVKDFSDETTILLIGSLDNMDIAQEKNAVYPEHIFTHNLNTDFSKQMIDNGINIAISEGCSDKDKAWEFVKYITYKNREIAEEIGTYASVPVSQDNPYVRINETKFLPSAQECLAELTKAGVAVLDGEKTPEQALADCQAEWDRILG